MLNLMTKNCGQKMNAIASVLWVIAVLGTEICGLVGLLISVATGSWTTACVALGNAAARQERIAVAALRPLLVSAIVLCSSGGGWMSLCVGGVSVIAVLLVTWMTLLPMQALNRVAAEAEAA